MASGAIIRRRTGNLGVQKRLLRLGTALKPNPFVGLPWLSKSVIQHTTEYYNSN